MKTKCEDIARSVIKQLLEPLRYMSKSKAFYRGVVLLQEGIRKYFKRKRRFFRLLDTVFDKYFQLIKTDKIHTVVKHAPKSPKSPKAIAMSRKKRNTAIIPQTLEVDEYHHRCWVMLTHVGISKEIGSPLTGICVCVNIVMNSMRSWLESMP